MCLLALALALTCCADRRFPWDGLLKETIVRFTSDNSDLVGQHNCQRGLCSTNPELKTGREAIHSTGSL